MTNPLSLAVPLFRAFGVNVRLHLAYPLLVVGLMLRELFQKDAYVSPLDVFLFLVVMLFVSTLLHEFGHAFAARKVGGECEEILMWPLGGLAFCDTPREWKAHTVVAAAGPFVNLLLAVTAAGVLVGAGFIPTLNPLESPYLSPMKNYHDGRTYTSEYQLRLYEPNSAVPVPVERHRELTVGGQLRFSEKEDARGDKGVIPGKPDELARAAEQATGLERAVAPAWAVWVNRFFWINMIGVLFNLLPAFPLDGGRILQGLVWWRTDYRQGAVVACVCGVGCAMALFVLSLVVSDPLVFAVCIAMLIACWLQWRQLTEGGGEYGFDTEQGYRGLDDEDEPRKKPQKKQGFLKRWQQARTAKKLQQEHEQRAQDDERMDGLLEKINRKEPLTAEEQAFMKRVSERYRKPQ